MFLTKRVTFSTIRQFQVFLRLKLIKKFQKISSAANTQELQFFKEQFSGDVITSAKYEHLY